jgi:hypothetical protein
MVGYGALTCSALIGIVSAASAVSKLCNRSEYRAFAQSLPVCRYRARKVCSLADSHRQRLAGRAIWGQGISNGGRASAAANAELT